MSVQFTVAIPTYNGASRLPLVLDRLRQQANTEHFNWEIMVVDNNSKDNTKEVVEEYQKNWPDRITLRYCFEAEQGLAFARQRGVVEAKGEWIGFLDDDNLPDCNWVAAAYLFGKEHPKAGAFGGQIHGDFEVEPPENFQRIQSFFAIRNRGEEPHEYDPENLSLPPGAGMVVRKQAWCENVPSRLVRTGRGGNDFEVLLHISRGGWEIWYNPMMNIYHQIPQYRLEREYLIALIRNAGLCICELRLIKIKNWQKPIIMMKIMLGSGRRALLHLLKYREKVKTDLVAACEMEFFLSSSLSPLFYLKNVLSRRLG
ncbi:MAG TPA: hormogonium polysaccharide biosynthesis glycosyltransferase HpsE [Leptolyngbyaceae cyanobacterium]